MLLGLPNAKPKPGRLPEFLGANSDGVLRSIPIKRPTRLRLVTLPPHKRRSYRPNERIER